MKQFMDEYHQWIVIAILGVQDPDSRLHVVGIVGVQPEHLFRLGVKVIGGSPDHLDLPSLQTKLLLPRL